MGRKKRYTPQSFESTNPARDTYAAVYSSMLFSDCCRDLSDHLFRLYVVCKDQYRGKRKPLADFSDDSMAELREELQLDDACFYLPWKDLAKYPGLYTEKGKSNFYKDMKKLEALGFIKIVSHGKGRSETIYRFSSEWKSRQT